MTNKAAKVVVVILLTLISLSALNASAADPLPSWTDGPTKTAILGFVTRVTDMNSTDDVRPEDLKRLDAMPNVKSVRLDVTVQSEIDYAVELVSGPFNTVKSTDDFLGAVLQPFGLKLDYKRNEATRPKIAEVLKSIRRQTTVQRVRHE